MQKRGLFPQDRGIGVARKTRPDATRHARPCGRAGRAHETLRWRKVAQACGRGHTSPRGRPGGRHVTSEGQTCEGLTG